MFAQVIKGKVSDAGAARAALDRWVATLAPGATGWLGSTCGVTDDGRFIAVARFESEEAAQRNSERPEQGQWWEETAKLFTGTPEFQNSRRVDVDQQGDPDTAGFVQIMQGRSSDPDRSRQLMNQDADKWAGFRPDVLGSVAIEHDAGAFTAVFYFTSEQAAREGEGKEPPPELKAQMDELNSLSIGEPEFFDLKDPWLQAPG
jgi:hypothetical protein